MKPQDLKQVFSFSQRRAFFNDQVFYVPVYCADYDKNALPPLNALFCNNHPVNVEYCSGNGDWIIEKARLNPEMNWFAIEKRFDRVRKIWSKLKNERLNNLVIVHGEAATFTKHFLNDYEIVDAYINFPDPWPKLRHAKHRLIQSPFLIELARVLKKEGKVTFVTDDISYLNETIEFFLKNPFFLPMLPPPYYSMEYPNYGNSWFEKLWREKGKEICYAKFVKPT